MILTPTPGPAPLLIEGYIVALLVLVMIIMRLVNRPFYLQEVGISNILDQPINHLIDFILAKSSQSFIINDLINYAVPYISKLCNLIKMEGVTVNALLRQFILEQAKQDLTPLHLALKQSFEVITQLQL